MSDGKVVFEIKGDPKGINTTLSDVTSNIEKESKKWDNAVKDSTEKGEGFFKGMLKGIVGAISAAGIAKLILDWGKAAVQAASDLQEVQNVVDVTFGDSSKQIQTWSEQAGKQYGLTETQAKRYASTIGAMLKSQGVAHEQMLSMSKDLAGLAADMASFYNLDFDTAFEKIRAGISGETEPLKQLGINMSVANLEAFALEKGIKKSYAAMSQGEQTLLRYQYLMKATADAQGDFARTSDSMANATRRVEASWDTIKTKGGSLLMTVVEPLTTGIADILDELTETRDQTAMDMFADIEKQTAAQLSAIESAYGKASDILKLMDKERKEYAQNSLITYEELFARIRDVENSGGNISEYLQSQGYDVEAVTQKYLYWKGAVKQLKDLYPSLAAEIEKASFAGAGSVEALNDNFDAFIENEEKKLEWTAYYAKKRALAEKRGNVYSYKLDYDAAQQAVKRLYETLLQEEKNADKKIEVWRRSIESSSKDIFNPHYGDIAYFYEAADTGSEALDNYFHAVGRVLRTQEEYTNQTDAITSAEQELSDAYNSLIGKYGEEADAAEHASDAVTDYGEKSAEAWKTSITGAKDAIEALADYVQSVRDSTENAVNSIVKGFETIERPTTELEKKRDKLIEQQNEINRSTRDGAKRYEELQTQIDDLNKSLDAYSPKGMQDALQSQLAFMDEYINNLEKAQQMGLSNDLLASLSDGSVQSAEYLAALVSNPEQAKEVDALFQQVQAKKNEFTNALTDQKLTVDETYQGMVETAKAAIDDMRMGAEASEATAETVQGMIEGMESKMPALSDEIDAILAELSRLSGIGIDFVLGGIPSGVKFFSGLFDAGEQTSAKSHGGTHGKFATGLDYVPFDGFVAELHEGESILTAEENRIWQRFKNGSAPQSMDYDALGATMRENVQAGGNVYLDGKTVGRVISDQQGNAYRQLQRSGWQQ